ncbi:hypothetical protein Bache_2325 [Bacteroides helcogenes P 36-108]|uniref:Uncharacterized protein n=1 Tax=Bacteroides helcogenes (strain ATCC 35417 / DSM 20613 / JCM 6297 / CCUG 15421 / P 36-108) TaxID=693979 RepID=E6STP6_BACT6|nr:hypothetical protein Bache_2325 [Bacteroides helcogenes P 36-108]
MLSKQTRYTLKFGKREQNKRGNEYNKKPFSLKCSHTCGRGFFILIKFCAYPLIIISYFGAFRYR